MTVNIGIVGTGTCGKAIMMRLNMLALPQIGWRLYAGQRSAGKHFKMQGKRYVVEELRKEDGDKPFDGLTRVIVCAPPDIAYHVAHQCVFSERAMRRTVIDCSDAFVDWDEVLHIDGSELDRSHFRHYAGVIVPRRRRGLERMATEVARIVEFVVTH